MLTLERILGLIEAIASRNVYLTLLVENPPARENWSSLRPPAHGSAIPSPVIRCCWMSCWTRARSTTR